ncbi:MULTISPECIES: fimbria/pilus periplasmic chaperone [Citrobacter]|uniref:fimbria/pilus periplasmic chaperone n=1 Tax=Citrobacter TaxID=544 RepID=UPI000299BF7D|nr:MULTISPECIES: fimbria/pilus periplasmic chaperone [Citrobacter]EKS55816.1 putative chaperone [Citrobacter freundii ATCC 8090 = MTCC 1658 = NBRC 12681]EKV0155739.1 fimbria/pilus periplasmic chaperone [Citrobacter freundii]ELK7390120.1 fimbria/pilus periplasmic chaperone [Citrobacter freundii]EXF29381.1 fimbrial assembly chaperone protein StcB [Citrobacter freundii RLS1]KFB99425.1 fimbrial chaperone [Citrobacter freundii ATCC 8090 = MTCC 1658 = NBRC 12681]
MKGLAVILIASIVLPAHAGIVIYGTRIIYPAEKNEVLVQLMNQGGRSSLVQSWIDDGDTSLPPEKIKVPFLLTPPVVKVAGDSGQQIKIKKMPNMLPDNKESLFFLNVLDIPPNNIDNAGKNVLKFAMQNRIKLFYRPKGISSVNKGTFQKLSMKRSGSIYSIKNDAANWITVTEVKANNVKINNETIMLAPLSSADVTLKSANANQYKITIIDDHGNYISDNVSLK